MTDRISAPQLPDDLAVEQDLYRVDIRETESRDLLMLAGAIGLDAGSQLADAALQVRAGGREVAVDWSGVSRLSGGALQVLLALRTALDARGMVLSVANDDPGVRRMLELAGVSQLFPLLERAG